jgi:hypothetical protein
MIILITLPRRRQERPFFLGPAVDQGDHLARCAPAHPVARAARYSGRSAAGVGLAERSASIE